MRSIKYWYRIFTWLAVLLVAVSSGACSGSLIPVTGNTASNTLTISGCYQIRFLGLSKDSEKATTTWRYQVDELSCAVQQLSDLMIAIPACATVVDASPASWEVLQPDPVLQSNGIKWKLLEEFQGGEFRLELSGSVIRGSVLAGIKSPNEAVGLIQGPVCDPNAPAPTATFTSTLTATTTSTLQPSPTISTTNTLVPNPFFPTLEPTQRTRPRPTITSTSAPISTSTPLPNTPTSAPNYTSTPIPDTPAPQPTNTSPPNNTDTAVPDTSAPDPTQTSKRPPTKTPKP
jgi:hypothetical protein